MNNLIAVIFILSLAIIGCKNGPDRPEAILDEGYTPTEATSVPTSTTGTTTPTPTEPPQNAEGVWHYTCPNGCAGGGGSATACAGCGTTLAHNQEYHN